MQGGLSLLVCLLAVEVLPLRFRHLRVKNLNKMVSLPHSPAQDIPIRVGLLLALQHSSWYHATCMVGLSDATSLLGTNFLSIQYYYWPKCPCITYIGSPIYAPGINLISEKGSPKQLSLDTGRPPHH